MIAQSFVSRLEAAWRARDVDAIAALFTPDGRYYRGPFGEPHTGFEAIRAHWVATLSRQVNPRIWFGKPIEVGDRASVQWWCILHDPATDVPRTAAGCLSLRFAPDGRCAEFREYWQAVQETALEPPQDWFS